jgi:hypothetical protein
MLETTIAQLGLFSLGATSFIGGLIGLGLILSVLREMRLVRLEAALRSTAAARSLQAVTPEAMSARATQVVAAVVVQSQSPVKANPFDGFEIHIIPDDDTAAAPPVQDRSDDHEAPLPEAAPVQEHPLAVTH